MTSITSKFGDIKLRKFNIPFSKKTVYGITINNHLYVSTKKGIRALIQLLESGGTAEFEFVKKSMVDTDQENTSHMRGMKNEA